MIPHTLTAENYFSPENSTKYLGSSQFKSFLRCEAAALAELRGEYQREVSDALLIGSYVDAHYEGTLDIFRAQHSELFTRSGELAAKYKHAEYMIQRAERDELFSRYMAGEKQVIMVGEIAGVPYKIKIDSSPPGACIVDLKCVKDLKPVWNEEKACRQHFIDYWGYTTQGAIYREIVRQNTGNVLPFYIAAITKEKEPQLRLYWVPGEVLDDRLAEVESLTPRIQRIKGGTLTPQRCGDCAYCRFTNALTGPVNYLDELEVYNGGEG